MQPLTHPPSDPRPAKVRLSAEDPGVKSCTTRSTIIEIESFAEIRPLSYGAHNLTGWETSNHFISRVQNKILQLEILFCFLSLK